MRYGIISDIHGNLEALTSVFADLQGRKYAHLLCLGDVIGYGANPNECTRFVMRNCTSHSNKNVPVVTGNHEYAATTGDVSGMNDRAASAALWTKDQLGEGEMKFLIGLPLIMRTDSILLVHGTPFEPDEMYYLESVSMAHSSFESLPEDVKVCFVGHTHCPMVFSRNKSGAVEVIHRSAIDIEEGSKYIVNVGSVGQPRDSNPDACYALYDDQSGTIEFHRVSYDIATAQRKIISAGLPEILSRRLALGQ